MDDIIFFLTEHWILSGIFLLLLIALITQEWISQSFGMATVSPEEAVLWINHKQAVVLDIRQPNLFLEGHILDALNLPAASLDKKMGLLQKHQDKPLIVVWSSSQEASKVVKVLKTKGYQAVTLKGGIQEWRTAGLPLVKKE